jgi:hypothetical protein
MFLVPQPTTCLHYPLPRFKILNLENRTLTSEECEYSWQLSQTCGFSDLHRALFPFPLFVTIVVMVSFLTHFVFNCESIIGIGQVADSSPLCHSCSTPPCWADCWWSRQFYSLWSIKIVHREERGMGNSFCMDKTLILLRMYSYMKFETNQGLILILAIIWKCSQPFYPCSKTYRISTMCWIRGIK